MAERAHARCSARSTGRCRAARPSARRSRRACAPARKSTRPSSTARATVRTVSARARVRPIAARSASASASGVGNRCSSPGANATGNAWPKRCASRAASVRAAATLTCWPMIARTAISKPSQPLGRRRPGRCAQQRAQARSTATARRRSPAGSASRSNIRRSRLTISSSRVGAAPCSSSFSACSPPGHALTRSQPGRLPGPIVRPITRA